jgi:hypothetical protein
VADNGSESRTLLSFAGSGVVILALLAGILLEVAQNVELRRLICSETGAFCSKESLAQMKSASVDMTAPSTSAPPPR